MIVSLSIWNVNIDFKGDLKFLKRGDCLHGGTWLEKGVVKGGEWMLGGGGQKRGGAGTLDGTMMGP